MTYKYSMETGLTKIKRFVKTKVAMGATIASSAAMLAAVPLVAHAAPANTNGFNEFGYNYNARIFSGAADGSDNMLDGQVWGDPTYANDHLVMKWNKAWDDCNAAGNNDASACLGAWTTNEWNGNVPGGSGETEHVKIVWVGSEEEASPYWVDGGYAIWGSYEVIQDKGMANGQQNVYAAATPEGLGYTKHL